MTATSLSLGKVVAVEVLLTFLLMFVIAASPRITAGQLAGVAIGATVALGALFGGPRTGVPMNRAASARRWCSVRRRSSVCTCRACVGAVAGWAPPIRCTISR